MAAHLSFLLILTGLTGIHSLTTVQKVSVQLGGSISIPCLYSSDYRNHIKYLCKGLHKSSCSYAVKTNQQSRSEKFSISDDPKQGIFTVTIKDMTTEDTDYWCFVEIDRGLDVGQYFQLSVTRGTPSLFVTHQEIMGFYGEKITINCSNSINGLIQWCKLGRSCVKGPSGSIDGTSVTTVTSVRNVFTVTMSGLRTESSGWYLFAGGDFQMPVHVNVNEKHTTTTATANATATATKRHTQSLCCSASTDARSIIITLSLLIFFVMVALFIWFILKHKQTKADSSATTMAEEEVTYSTVKHKRKKPDQGPCAESDVDVIYSSVVTMKQQNVKRGPCAESDVDVMYSSVVTMKQQNVKRVEAENKDVTYSTLSQRYQNM